MQTKHTIHLLDETSNINLTHPICLPMKTSNTLHKNYLFKKSDLEILMQKVEDFLNTCPYPLPDCFIEDDQQNIINKILLSVCLAEYETFDIGSALLKVFDQIIKNEFVPEKGWQSLKIVPFAKSLT